MRSIIVEPIAQDNIIAICDYVESKNTKGSGDRFYVRFLDFIESYAPLTNLKFPLCRNKDLAKRKWSCIIFQQTWVIAFSYTATEITIHRVVLGSNLR